MITRVNEMAETLIIKSALSRQREETMFVAMFRSSTIIGTDTLL